jgi:16S rRNA (guanine966-N2)-methyltransferase
MRVISGAVRGRRLKAPPGRLARPTADRVKEAVFNLLGGAWEGARVLDLFAGSGALGIEALSRGAAHCTFVDGDRLCAAVIRENLQLCGLVEKAAVVRGSALRFLQRRPKGVFDVIFADPPYQKGLASDCFKVLDRRRCLGNHGRFVVEHSRREAIPSEGDVLRLLDRRGYGDTRISVFGCKEKLEEA